MFIHLYAKIIVLLISVHLCSGGDPPNYSDKEGEIPGSLAAAFIDPQLHNRPSGPRGVQEPTMQTKSHTYDPITSVTKGPKRNAGIPTDTASKRRRAGPPFQNLTDQTFGTSGADLLGELVGGHPSNSIQPQDTKSEEDLTRDIKTVMLEFSHMITQLATEDDLKMWHASGTLQRYLKMLDEATRFQYDGESCLFWDYQSSSVEKIFHVIRGQLPATKELITALIHHFIRKLREPDGAFFVTNALYNAFVYSSHLPSVENVESTLLFNALIAYFGRKDLGGIRMPLSHRQKTLEITTFMLDGFESVGWLKTIVNLWFRIVSLSGFHYPLVVTAGPIFQHAIKHSNELRMHVVAHQHFPKVFKKLRLSDADCITVLEWVHIGVAKNDTFFIQKIVDDGLFDIFSLLPTADVSLRGEILGTAQSIMIQRMYHVIKAFSNASFPVIVEIYLSGGDCVDRSIFNFLAAFSNKCLGSEAPGIWIFVNFVRILANKGQRLQGSKVRSYELLYYVLPGQSRPELWNVINQIYSEYPIPTPPAADNVRLA